jgi:hypothetical protein
MKYEMELIELCQNVRDEIFERLYEEEVRTEEDFDEHIDFIRRQEIDDASIHLSGCQEEAILKCIGYGIGRCIETLVGNFGTDIFKGLNPARINVLIISQAIECSLEDDDEITFEKYQVYCSSKTD